VRAASGYNPEVLFKGFLRERQGIVAKAAEAASRSSSRTSRTIPVTAENEPQ